MVRDCELVRLCFFSPLLDVANLSPRLFTVPSSFVAVWLVAYGRAVLAFVIGQFSMDGFCSDFVRRMLLLLVRLLFIVVAVEAATARFVRYLVPI